jgi:hypothetical protein
MFYLLFLWKGNVLVKFPKKTNLVHGLLQLTFESEIFNEC